MGGERRREQRARRGGYSSSQNIESPLHVKGCARDSQLGENVLHEGERESDGERIAHLVVAKAQGDGARVQREPVVGREGSPGVLHRSTHRRLAHSQTDAPLPTQLCEEPRVDPAVSPQSARGGAPAGASGRGEVLGHPRARASDSQGGDAARGARGCRFIAHKVPFCPARECVRLCTRDAWTGPT